MGNSAGQGSISLSQKADGGGPPVIDTLQTVTFNGDTTTILSFFNGGIRTIIPGSSLKWGVTDSDFVPGFPGSAATVQINHGAGNFGLAISRATSDGTGANFIFYRTRGGGVASVLGALVDGNRVMNLQNYGVCANAITVAVCAGIESFAIPINAGNVYGAGLPANNVLPGLLDFKTTDMGGLHLPRLRVMPNGEIMLVDQAAIVPSNGKKLQITGGATITQSVKIGSNVLPDASAMLDLQSTVAGFLPPRMTNAQRLAIPAPAVGLMVYCTDAVEGLYINKIAGWIFII